MSTNDDIRGRLSFDDAGDSLAAALDAGPNDSTIVNAALLSPGSAPDSGPSKHGAYSLGPPKVPAFAFDNFFEWNSKEPNVFDHLNAAKWKSIMLGGSLLNLEDAVQLYAHFWENTGEPMVFDYAEAYEEDDGVREFVEYEIARAKVAVDTFIADGRRDFSVTGNPKWRKSVKTASGTYPSSENWQKTIGDYAQWSSADVRVIGNRVEMTITVHANDRYNFNRGARDVRSGLEDDENGRFEEIGWARSFDSSGSLTKTISWKVGDDVQTVVEDSSPHSDRGGEDRRDGRRDGE